MVPIGHDGNVTVQVAVVEGLRLLGEHIVVRAQVIPSQVRRSLTLCDRITHMIQRLSNAECRGVRPFRNAQFGTEAITHEQRIQKLLTCCQ